jgi:hypothetical protein
MICLAGPERVRPCVPRTSPSSRGLGRGPFKAETRVRIPVGTNPPSLRSVEFAPTAPQARGSTRCVAPAGTDPGGTPTIFGPFRQIRPQVVTATAASWSG